MSVQSLKLRLFVLLLLQASEFLFSLHVCLVGEFIRFDCLAGFLRFPDALLILLLLLDRQLEAVVGGLERGFRVAESLLFLLVNLPLIVCRRLFISGSLDLFSKILHLLLPDLHLFLAVGPLPGTFLDRGKFFLALVLQFLEPVNNRLQPVKAKSKNLHVEQRFEMSAGLGRLGIKRPGQPPLLHPHQFGEQFG